MRRRQYASDFSAPQAKTQPVVPHEYESTMGGSLASERMAEARKAFFLAWREWLRADRPGLADAQLEAEATFSVLSQLAVVDLDAG